MEHDYEMAALIVCRLRWNRVTVLQFFENIKMKEYLNSQRIHWKAGIRKKALKTMEVKNE